MANYSIETSFMLYLPKIAMDTFMLLVEQVDNTGFVPLVGGEEYGHSGARIELEPLELDIDRIGAWISTDDCSINVEFMADAIEYILRTYQLDEIVGFEWSTGCTKPRLDAFGGGAVVITKDGQEWVDTTGWVWRQKAKILKGREPSL